MMDDHDEMSKRLGLVSRALKLEYLSVGWGTISASWSIVAGLRSGSLGVVGLGLVVLADLGGSLAVIWRLHWERRDPSRAQRAEVRASQLVAAALMVVAVVLFVVAIEQLVTGSVPNQSTSAVASAIAAAALLAPLGLAKYRVGVALRSPSLRGDGSLSLVGAALGVVALAGLGANALWQWWWADRAAALVAVVFMVVESQRVFRDRPRTTT